MNILLIGYRGTGKSSVGRLLAARLGWPLVDADEEIERAAGKSVSAIFAEGGEAAFRDLEEKIVAELTMRENSIISLGGGAVLRAANRQAIKEAGKVVWLTASPATIQQRVKQDATTALRRPNLTTRGGLAEIEELLAQRKPLYEECADVVIDTEHDEPDIVAGRILRELSHE